MSVTAFFLISAFLSPVLAGSILAHISVTGPEPTRKGFVLPALVLASLAAAVGALAMDFDMGKLAILSASGLLTVVLMLVAMVVTTFPAEFPKRTR